MDYLKDVNRNHFFKWLESIGIDGAWEAAVDNAEYPYEKGGVEASEFLEDTVKRYKRLQEMEDVDWDGKHTWILAFANMLRRSENVVTRNKLHSEDGLAWVIDMFELWARNQNVHKIPTGVMLEFMQPCTDDVGCILRNEKICPVCNRTKIDISKHDYHLMETDKGTYRRNSANNWEVLIGESWESCYSEEAELEAIFQQNSDI